MLVLAAVLAAAVDSRRGALGTLDGFALEVTNLGRASASMFGLATARRTLCMLFDGARLLGQDLGRVVRRLVFGQAWDSRTIYKSVFMPHCHNVRKPCPTSSARTPPQTWTGRCARRSARRLRGSRIASKISSSVNGGALFDSWASIHESERNCSTRRGYLEKWGGWVCSASRLLLASLNFGNDILTAGVKSVFSCHDNDAGEVRPTVGRRERAQCMRDEMLILIRTTRSPVSSSFSCVMNGTGRRLRLRSHSPDSMLSSNVAIRFLTFIHLIDGDTGARRPVACEVAIVVTASLPLVELPVDVPDALDEPCEGLEGRAFMYLVHLDACTAWPLRTSLVSKRDEADEKGGRALARVARHLG